MGKPSAAPQSTPHSLNGGDGSVSPALKSSQRSAFLVMILNMSWQLAVVVLVPVIAGVQLDKKLDTSYITFVGLAVAFIGAALVMWHTMQTANRLPVPKLTEAQKRAIQKQYEEDDADV
jgi:hypothetical protein